MEAEDGAKIDVSKASTWRRFRTLEHKKGT